jgi:hypothetical protein
MLIGKLRVNSLDLLKMWFYLALLPANLLNGFFGACLFVLHLCAL